MASGAFRGKSMTRNSFDAASKLRKSGSLRPKTSNLAPSFTGSKSRASELDNIESEYIKNLQQQVYFLELEANFLREQARKATELQPQVSFEAEKMMKKLRGVQNDMEDMNIEMRRRDSNLTLVKTEKDRLAEKLNTAQDAHAREKKMLVQEIVQLKKQIEEDRRESMRKENQIMTATEELNKGSNSLSDANHQIQILKAQVDQKSEQVRSTHMALEEKRTELLKVQTNLHETEEKYYSSTASLQDRTTSDLRDEIRMLKQKMKEAEITAQQDRYLKNKMSDDCGNLVKENALLGAQVLELQKQMDRERSLREERDTRRAASITELLSTRDKENHLQFELEQVREQLKQERDRVKHLMDKVTEQEQLNSTTHLSTNTLRSRLNELESLHSGTEMENTQLRRDKMLLVDHVSDLQKQLSEKDQEILYLHSQVSSTSREVDELSRHSRLESSLQSQKWNELEKMAENMKTLSMNMSLAGRSPSPQMT